MTDGTALPPTGSPVAGTQRWAALAVLTACVFLVGTAEWVMVGLLPDLAEDLNLPLPVAGSLVTWYALTVTVAGPLVTVLILPLPRKRALLGMLAVFVVGNVVAASAGEFRVLLAARIFTALIHSTSFAVILVTAVAMVPAAQRGRAIAVVATGWNLATVFGAPLGTWIGNNYGWRATFWCISALSVLAILAAAICVRPAEHDPAADVRIEVRALRNRRVMAVMGIIVAAQAGLFTAYTYITPLLAQVSGFGPPAITALLALFGVGGLAGNILGGWLADRAPWGALCALLAALATVLAAFTVTSHERWAATATMLLLGVLSAALIPLLQERGLAAAPLAPTLVTAICASAFNLGVAGGSKLGGQALHAGLDLTDLTWIGSLVTLATLPLATHAALRQHGISRHRPEPADRPVRPATGTAANPHQPAAR